MYNETPHKSILSLICALVSKNGWLLFIYLVALGVSCGMWTLSCSMHMGSSSLTRDQTWTPCIGSVESYPLHHQGSPGWLLKYSA